MGNEVNITIDVDAANPSHAVSPLLYGVFLEEINFGGVGGIYAEKIQNRAFMDKRTPKAWPGPEVSRSSGRFRNAVELNGETRNARIALPDGIVASLTAFSVAAWVNPTRLESFAKLFDFGDAQTGFMFYHAAGAHMSLALASAWYMGDGAGAGPSFVISIEGKKETLNAPEALTPGQWSHLAVTMQAGTAKLFVNGSVVAEKTNLTLTPAQMGHTRNNVIGASQFAVDPMLQGRVSDFHIFDRALTDTEVKSLMDAPAGSVGGGNVAWYQFGEEGGAAVTDSSGANHHARVVEHESPWQAVMNGGGALTAVLDDEHPLNAQLTRSLRLDIANVEEGQRVGMSNTGYFGVPAVAGQTNRVAFWAKAAGDVSAPLCVGIEKADGSHTLVSAQVSGLTTEWRQFNASLTIPADAGSSADNRFFIGIDRRNERASPGQAGASSATIWLQVISLFPPTYKNRENGLRRDLVELLQDLRPRFLRFPGGTFVLGHTVETRWDWKKTIGPVATRPGHDNDVWRYWSDDGLGLMEYLLLAEDLSATPVIGVYPGLSGGRPVPQDELAPFVQDALDLIEYAIGPATSTWGARRAADGHPAPFETPIIEIGNEDFLGVGDTYNAYRYPMFYNAIKAAYPHVKTIATMPVADHPVEVLDEHMYRAPEALIERAEKYDAYDRSGPQIFVGEWSVITGAGSNATGDLAAAVAEAAFMTVLERNSDIVAMQCYAPLFAFDGHTQWNPDLIGFDQLTAYGSTSYWAQVMFASNVGDQYIPVSTGSKDIYCSATLESKSGKIFVKVANLSGVSRDVLIVFQGSTAAEVAIEVLTSDDPAARNSLAEPRRVAPQRQALRGEGGKFKYAAPPHSAAVVCC